MSPANDLRSILSSTLDLLSRARKEYKKDISLKEVGTITSVLNGVATAAGLSHLGVEELVHFEGGSSGFVFDLEEEEFGAILLQDPDLLKAGFEVSSTGQAVDIAVGDALLGRVIDAQANPLDRKDSLSGLERWPIQRPAPDIIDRAPVTAPLQTGLKVIDALIPIGHGQRELILGDRQTGKTALAIDAIINQRGKNVICIYCAIGQRLSAVAKVIADLKKENAMDYTIIMVTKANDPPGRRYVAPYAATSIAEYFMHKGRQVLIVYDNLTNHARSYRELSLLLKRPPGREAFPGDIFHIHASLLERATHLSKELGGGSLTALPIIETEAQDISAYIPTNLISITDGQIFLSAELFEKGVLPAIDVNKSVSRVGGKAQVAAYREVIGDLKISYAQFEELEVFARFGTQLDEETHHLLNHGRRIRWCLNQNRLDPLDVSTQIFILLAFTKGLLDKISLDRLDEAEKALRQSAENMKEEDKKHLMTSEKMDETIKNRILDRAKEVLSKFEVQK